jgi:hypothetical protein
MMTEQSLMSEQSLLNILNAANPNDAEDVAMRKFLVETLRECIDFPAAFPPAVAASEHRLGR